MSGSQDNPTASAPSSSQASASAEPSRSRKIPANGRSPISVLDPEELAHITESSNAPTSNDRRSGDYGRRSQRARGSGGFLLQDAVPPYPSETEKRPLRQVMGDSKGKGRAENGDITPIRKRTAAERHRQKLSVGSSPLSTVVYNDTSGPTSSRIESPHIHQITQERQRSSAQEEEDLGGSYINGDQSGLEGRTSGTGIPSAVGYNTDPAQIVNLALNLSESRRRHVSGGRLSPAYIGGARRQVSSEANTPGYPARHVSIAGGNLRSHLNDQRRVSRTSAPRSSIQSWESHSPRSVKNSDEGDISTSPGLYEPGAAEEVILKPSEATLARAEKARVAFELSYQYRRLLQYLPKLPGSSPKYPASQMPENACQNASSENLGRAYDPLQYIRNRRARGRERKHLDAEAEGWKDPDKVRLWVDKVADAHGADSPADTKHDLPPLDPSLIDTLITQGSPKSPVSGKNNARPTRSERQSSGWAFTPWDLLADAAWLSRDDHMMLIEDAKGKKLVPAPPLPRESTPRASLEQARSPGKRSLSLSRSVAPEEQSPSDPSVKKKHRRNLSHIRGKSFEANAPVRDHESPKDRKGGWRRNFIRSRSESSSGDSLPRGANGYAWGSHHDREGLDSVALEKQMMELLAKEIDNDPFSRPTKVDSAKERPIRDRRAVNNDDGKVIAIWDRPEDLNETPTRSAPKPQPMPIGIAQDDQRGRRPRLSLDELDDTAPNSPSLFHFGPSIFVNRSAPNSRSVSPKKSLPSRLMRHSRSQSRRAVSDELKPSTGSPIKADLQRAKAVDNNSGQSELQKTDSSNNLLSPITAELFGKRFRRLNNSSASVKSAKESKDPESRFRGILKGTRIAELVGNEVSRVGDMIWRRDGNLSQSNPPISQRIVGDSDTDGEYSTLENTPDNDLSRATTNNDDGGSISRVSTKTGQPRYHHPNLPTFRSSTTQASPGSPKGASPEDHPIVRQQLAQKARGRSQKFERLAPPKIDMRNVSPSASPPLSRIQTTDTNNFSRDPSSSRSTNRVRTADRRLNDVLGIPGTVRQVATPTGLTNLSSKASKNHNSNRPDLGDRDWSISDRSVSNARSGTVTKRDIARVRALLLSSGIKANEISRQAHTIDDPPFLPQLRELHQRSGKPIQRVPRAQEHLLAAKLIIAEIDVMNQKLRDQAEQFSNETIDSLHQRFKDLDARVSDTLVPQVRASADDADALSIELTNTHTLSVKRISESVEALLRRRRRRGKWVRRGGWVIVEWSVLGLLWKSYAFLTVYQIMIILLAERKNNPSVYQIYLVGKNLPVKGDF
ncbi:MAG: hypothetical protein Q9208_007837 [Pyrenodesmia sp. 3 TL-2023]